jgi:hypothetical protein
MSDGEDDGINYDGIDYDGIECEVRKSADVYSCNMLLHTISPREREELTKAEKREIDEFIDSAGFRLLSTSGRKENRGSRKGTFFVEEDLRCTDAIDRGSKYVRENQARLVFASRPTNITTQPRRVIQKREPPVCLFVNLLGTRRSLCEEPACSSYA